MVEKVAEAFSETTADRSRCCPAPYVGIALLVTFIACITMQRFYVVRACRVLELHNSTHRIG